MQIPVHNSTTEARRWIFAQGMTVTEWAQKNGFDRTVVYSVLLGKTVGLRGSSRRVAEALGLGKMVEVKFNQSLQKATDSNPLPIGDVHGKPLTK